MFTHMKVSHGHHYLTVALPPWILSIRLSTLQKTRKGAKLFGTIIIIVIHQHNKGTSSVWRHGHLINLGGHLMMMVTTISHVYLKCVFLSDGAAPPPRPPPSTALKSSHRLRTPAMCVSCLTVASPCSVIWCGTCPAFMFNLSHTNTGCCWHPVLPLRV